MVFAMSLKCLAIFAVVSTLSHLKTVFDVSSNTILTVATIYEFGKLAGAFVYGIVLPRYNMVTVLLRSMDLFVLLVLALLIVTWIMGTNNMKGWFPAFAVAYFAISFLSISTQFGLNVLKITNEGDRNEYRRWVSYQGILASICQGGFTVVGGVLMLVFGPFSGFYTMGIYCIFARIALGLSTNDGVIEMLSPARDRKEESKSAALNAYMTSCWKLLTEKKFRRFQGFLVALAGSSGTHMHTQTRANAHAHIHIDVSQL